MMIEQPWSGSLSRRQRIVTAATVAALHLALGFALFAGWGDRIAAVAERTLAVIDLTPMPPPVVVERRPLPQRKAERPAGEAAPPNLKQNPTEIVAPPPVLPIEPPPPVVAAPVAGTGAAPDAGAAPVIGPGTGAGGVGNGRGSGGAGDGDGGGGDDGDTPPRQLRGALRNSDFPEGIGVGGRVSVRYVINIDGRVSDCKIDRSSGNAELDATTCRLITERYRFRPARDSRGRPEAYIGVENHDWVVEG